MGNTFCKKCGSAIVVSIIDIAKDKNSGFPFIDAYMGCSNNLCVENSNVRVYRCEPLDYVYQGPTAGYRPAEDVEVIQTINISELKHIKKAIETVMKLRIAEYENGEKHTTSEYVTIGG